MSLVCLVTVLLGAAEQAGAQISTFVQERWALVGDDDTFAHRFTGLQVLNLGEDWQIKGFHIRSRPFSVVETAVLRRVLVLGPMKVVLGPEYIDNKFLGRLLGPRLGLDFWDGMLTVPLARRLWSVDGDSDTQWAIIADFKYKTLRVSAQTFNSNWEVQVGLAPVTIWGVEPDLRLALNNQGWGVESRLNWFSSW